MRSVMMLMLVSFFAGPAVPAQQGRGERQYMRKLAALSGGRAYFPDSLNDLEQVWRDIAGGIRTQYTIGYHFNNPNRDGMFRRVKITAGRNGGRGLRVTTRDGYFAPADVSITR